MIRQSSVLALVALMALSACNGNKTKTDANQDGLDSTITEGVDLLPDMSDRDSTIYGKAEGFGQSAFTLIAEDGTEYDIALTSEDLDEHYGEVYGDREDTARYAVTTRDCNESLGVMINLSQLEKFTTNYEIYNGQLILITDGVKEAVNIIQLDDNVFKAEGWSGKVYEFKK